MADFALLPPSNDLSTFDELRKELDENAINAIVRMDLETLIREHGDEEFIEADSRINKKKLERNDGVFWYKPQSTDSPVLLVPPKFRTNLI